MKNAALVKRAIEEAIPNSEKIGDYRKRIDRIEKELEKMESGRSIILRFVHKGLITDDQAEKELRSLKNTESRLRSERERLCDNLENEPDPDKVKAVSKKVARQFKKYGAKKFSERKSRARRTKLAAKIRLANHDYDGMTQQERRVLVEMVFSGKTRGGKRMGVYLACPSFRFFASVGRRLEYWLVNLARLSTDVDPLLSKPRSQANRVTSQPRR